jgi:hypothetical protein
MGDSTHFQAAAKLGVSPEAALHLNVLTPNKPRNSYRGQGETDGADNGHVR